MTIKHVVSVSGGKDSLATLLIAIARFGRASVVAIFCDTGNEHEEVYAYLDYLEEVLGIKIFRLKANFDAEIANKRVFISRDVRHKRQYETRPVFEADGKTPVPKRDGFGNIVTKQVKRGGVLVEQPVQKTVKIGGGRRMRWTNKAKRRALAVLHPTGIPFLDLCMWKGRFPSRTRQFCTDFLKVIPATEFQLALVDEGHTVVSWQGVRRDESMNRRDAKIIERLGPGMWIYRPIAEWSAAMVFAWCALFGIKPNPLYLQDMSRVGCMPCINANKKELAQIARRFIRHVDRIFTWEQLVSACSKRQAATFIPAPWKGEKVANQAAHATANNIYSVIEWAKTSRGGKQFDLLVDAEEISVCSSSYGLCE